MLIFLTEEPELGTHLITVLKYCQKETFFSLHWKDLMSGALLKYAEDQKLCIWETDLKQPYNRWVIRTDYKRTFFEMLSERSHHHQFLENWLIF